MTRPDLRHPGTAPVKRSLSSKGGEGAAALKAAKHPDGDGLAGFSVFAWWSPPARWGLVRLHITGLLLVFLVSVLAARSSLAASPTASPTAALAEEKPLLIESPRMTWKGTTPTGILFDHPAHVQRAAEKCETCHPPISMVFPDPGLTASAAHPVCRQCHAPLGAAQTSIGCNNCHRPLPSGNPGGSVSGGPLGELRRPHEGMFLPR